MKKRIFVIDDSWESGRDSYYESALSEKFEVISLSKQLSPFEQISTTAVDIYLIDIVLVHIIDPENNKPLELEKVLKCISSSKPIFLVSNEYLNLVIEGTVTDLLTSISLNYRNVIGFFQWSEFIATNDSKLSSFKSSISNRIELEFLNFLERKKNKSLKNADIGIISALEIELIPFLSHFEKKVLTTERIGNLIITLGNLKTHTGKIIKFVAARQDRMGMVDASFLTSLLVTTYNLRHLFHIGVCGGRDLASINFGDLIIPSESIAYQGGKISDIGFSSAIESSLCNCVLNQYLTNEYTTDLLKRISEIYKNILSDTSKEYGYISKLNLPNIHYDPMACGDLIINKKGEIDRIATKASKRKLCSVDMESYSILRASQLFENLTTVVIKSVMDKTSNKSDRYKSYAAFVSANFLYYILCEEKYPVIA